MNQMKKITMSEFIECLMEYLDINLCEIEADKVEYIIDTNKFDTTNTNVIFRDFYKCDIEIDNCDSILGNSIYLFLDTTREFKNPQTININNISLELKFVPFYIDINNKEVDEIRKFDNNNDIINRMHKYNLDVEVIEVCSNVSQTNSQIIKYKLIDLFNDFVCIDNNDSETKSFFYDDDDYNDETPGDDEIQGEFDIVLDNLESYVYIYMNPLKKLEKPLLFSINGDVKKINYEPFYIGKGIGARMFKHLKISSSDTNVAKKEIIKDIYKHGEKPVIEKSYYKHIFK